MWNDRYEYVCRTVPDLAAIYESPHGQLALLLRHTLVPLVEEHPEWLSSTRDAVRALVPRLRGSGFSGSVLVLQWLPVDQVADIVQSWRCRYDGDPERRARLSRVAERYADDQRFLTSQMATVRPRPRVSQAVGPALDATARATVMRWYGAMGPCWLTIEPEVRRTLVFRVHRWLADRVLERGDDDATPPGADLGVDGALARNLAALVPPDERPAWRRWIRVVVADLERALSWPPTKRHDAWARWLFLIPYSVPVPAALSLIKGGAGRPHGRASVIHLPIR
jgi:hypothetical protein